MSDTAVAAARKLKDSTNQYLWQPGLVSGEPNAFLGRPLFTDPNVDAPGLSKKSVIFGDMSKYFIRDVAGVRVERSVDFAFQNDLVTWRFILRTDGDLIDTTGAVKVFVGGAS
jgi:HK97 family phage major capsid protein